MAITERLLLRLMRTEDAGPLSPIASAEWVRKKVGTGELSPWTIVRRENDEVCGFCGFFIHPVKGTTLGYGILPTLRGQGIATEAADAALTWAETRDIDVYVSIRPPNPASVRVLEKLGLTLRDHYVDDDGERMVFRR